MGTAALPATAAAPPGTGQVRINTAAEAAAAAPPVVAAAVFTGVVRQVVNPRTLLVARDAPAAASAARNRTAGEAGVVPVTLYGVAPLPAGSAADAGARKFLGQLVGRRVRVTVRRGVREDPRAVRDALVYVLPGTGSGGTVDAPPPPAEQKAPPVALVPTRTPEASGTAPDLPPGGPDRPNVPTAANIPVPPAAPAVRADDCVNYALVRQGLGRWNHATAADGSTAFADAEKDAQKARRGIWAARSGGR